MITETGYGLCKPCETGDHRRCDKSVTVVTPEGKGAKLILCVCGCHDGVRRFETGAVRGSDGGKVDYEGFLSPLVLREFAGYMNRHRKLPDGSLRDSDDWQKGMPREVYMKSAWRHFMAWWANHRGVEADESAVSALCGVLFNVQGYLHEVLTQPPPPPPPPAGKEIFDEEAALDA